MSCTLIANMRYITVTGKLKRDGIPVAESVSVMSPSYTPIPPGSTLMSPAKLAMAYAKITEPKKMVASAVASHESSSCNFRVGRQTRVELCLFESHLGV